MKCRDCGRTIAFVQITTTGRPMPIDPKPDRAGNVAAHYGTAGGLVGRVLTKERPGPVGEERLYTPHKATCPAIRRKPRPDPPPTLF